MKCIRNTVRSTRLHIGVSLSHSSGSGGTPDTNVYMLDAEGNRVKDSYGNDIIMPQ